MSLERASSLLCRSVASCVTFCASGFCPPVLVLVFYACLKQFDLASTLWLNQVVSLLPFWSFLIQLIRARPVKVWLCKLDLIEHHWLPLLKQNLISMHCADGLLHRAWNHNLEETEESDYQITTLKGELAAWQMIVVAIAGRYGVQVGSKQREKGKHWISREHNCFK